ncbi:MAG: hypothetical protein WDZ35_13085 [Crocinitomicaceae bacterium]
MVNTTQTDSCRDYFTFGMMLPGRNGGSSNYRYGFQNQEVDPEIKGEGNSVNYKYRMHDPRIGRFFAVDPLAPRYPHNSPYAFSENRVVDALELEGLEMVVVDDYFSEETQNTIMEIIKGDEWLSEIILNRENKEVEAGTHLLIVYPLSHTDERHGFTVDITSLAMTYLNGKKAPATDLKAKQDALDAEKALKKLLPDFDLGLLSEASNISVIAVNKKLIKKGIARVAQTFLHEMIAHYIDILDDPETAHEEKGTNDPPGMSDHLEYFGLDESDKNTPEYKGVIGKGVDAQSRSPQENFKPGSSADKVDKAIKAVLPEKDD